MTYQVQTQWPIQPVCHFFHALNLVTTVCLACRKCCNKPEAKCLSHSFLFFLSVCDQKSSCIRPHDGQNTSHSLPRPDLWTPPLTSVHYPSPLTLWQSTSHVSEAVCCWRWELAGLQALVVRVSNVFQPVLDTNFEPHLPSSVIVYHSETEVLLCHCVQTSLSCFFSLRKPTEEMSLPVWSCLRLRLGSTGETLFVDCRKQWWD